jgi:hypothetical protein
MNARAKTSSLLLVGRRVRPIIIPGYVHLALVRHDDDDEGEDSAGEVGKITVILPTSSRE